MARKKSGNKQVVALRVKYQIDVELPIEIDPNKKASLPQGFFAHVNCSAVITETNFADLAEARLDELGEVSRPSVEKLSNYVLKHMPTHLRDAGIFLMWEAATSVISQVDQRDKARNEIKDFATRHYSSAIKRRIPAKRGPKPQSSLTNAEDIKDDKASRFLCACLHGLARLQELKRELNKKHLAILLFPKSPNPSSMLSKRIKRFNISKQTWEALVNDCGRISPGRQLNESEIRKFAAI